MLANATKCCKVLQIALKSSKIIQNAANCGNCFAVNCGNMQQHVVKCDKLMKMKQNAANCYVQVAPRITNLKFEFVTFSIK